ASAFGGIPRSSLLERPLRQLIPALGLLVQEEIRPEQVSRRLFNLLGRNDALTWDAAGRISLGHVLAWRNAGLKTVREMFAVAISEGLRVAASSQHAVVRREPERRPPIESSEVQADLLQIMDSLERIAAWGYGERGLTRLDDALQLASSTLPDELPNEIGEAVKRLEGIDLRALGARHLNLFDINVAALRVRESLDDRSTRLLVDRTFCMERAPTLEDFGNQFGVTRERVRQMEGKAIECVRVALSHPDNQVIQRLALRLRIRLGRVNRREIVPAALRELGVSDGDDFTRSMLLWLAGPYTQFDEWVTRGRPDAAVRDTLELLDELTSEDPVDVDEALSQLTELEIEEGLRREWVAGLKRYRFLENYLVRWAGSVGDKAEVVLRIVGSPMTREEILSVIGEKYSRGTLTNCLLGEERFLRRGLDHFGLAEWGGEEYTSIVDELTEEIERQGGEASLEHLVDVLSTTFGVSPASVRSYAASQRFVKTPRGTVRLRTQNDALPKTRAVESTRGCFCLNGAWTYQVPVNSDLLRGSGMVIPPGFATHIGVEAGGSIECQSEFGPVRFAWPSMQPQVSSLRRVAEGLGAVDGDFLNTTVADESVTFSLIRRSDTETLTGLERFMCRLGIKTREEQPLPIIAESVGLDPSTATVDAVRRRLRARGEDDLLPMLPDHEGDADHSASSLDELLDVLSGRRK
ncbi:MAG: hypothetical protein M3198_14920, partial [Actinomycetota bacterium]|nr:hypothetical protein [Actinomycetota bacterium]